MSKRIVVNLQEMRGKQSDQAVIVDFSGAEHVLQPLTLDGYLGIVHIQERYAALNDGDPAPADIVSLMTDVRDVITFAVPTFPVGGLRLDELFLVVNALQASTPGSQEVADAGPTGEAHP